jgi:predicted DNA-binding protein
MAALNVRIPDDLNETLIKSAKYLDRAKGYLVRKALEEYLLELQEDIEDYNDAVEISAQNNPRYSLEEVMKELEFDEMDLKK